MRRPSVSGIIAEFDRPEALIEAAQRVQEAGYTKVDAFSPFPLTKVNEILGYKPSWFPYVPLAAAIVGGAVQYFAQYWMNVIDYPINVGGRPLHSWPPFLPSMIIVAILWAGVTTFLILLFAARLPRLNHPVFAVPDFERASQDRFFIWIRADDPLFDLEETSRLLTALNPQALREVPG
ncbi:DUF3341 domain-containing protein [Microvirga roseola]|uniref:DUF3341 domain-containing protein n=1 Tax=Microvirga roseola TaxID=2883126 RepID=UPI001E3F259A|nr:DUF3341 domain-containing protein [Microvirga roseola]